MTRDRTAENVEQFYSSLSATGYDALKAGDDRQVWAAQLRPLLHRHAPGAATALDLGCGTGDSAAMLADFGLRVVGCDIATDMLESARRKYPHIHFRQADIRTVPPDLRGFDVVTMCGDIPNHLLSQADLVATLRGAVAALRVGGVLVMDANSDWTFEQLYGATTVLEYESDYFIWSRVGAATSDLSIYRLNLTRFSRQRSGWDRTDHVVEERFYPLADLKDAVRDSGAQVVETLGIRRGQVVDAATPDVVKWILLARRVAG